MTKKNDLKAAEARRRWAREQLRADPYRLTYGGPGNLLDAMRKKFGVAIDMRALSQIRKEVLEEKGITAAEVTARYRTKVAKKPRTKPSAPMAYFGKQLTTITKMLQKALPDLTRFVMTTSEGGETAVEYTLRQTSEVSGKVKL